MLSSYIYAVVLVVYTDIFYGVTETISIGQPYNQLMLYHIKARRCINYYQSMTTTIYMQMISCEQRLITKGIWQHTNCEQIVN